MTLTAKLKHAMTHNDALPAKEWAKRYGCSLSRVYQTANAHGLHTKITVIPLKTRRGTVPVECRGKHISAQLGVKALRAAGLDKETRLAFAVDAGRIVITKETK